MEDVILFQELLWGNALKKTPPPESVVMSEPAPKRSRTEERSSSSLRIQVIQERLETVRCQDQDIEMYHLDEIVRQQK